MSGCSSRNEPDEQMFPKRRLVERFMAKKKGNGTSTNLGLEAKLCCGSGGMFVQSGKFVLEHGGRLGDTSIYGRESTSTTLRLALMNRVIRGSESKLDEEMAHA